MTLLPEVNLPLLKSELENDEGIRATPYRDTAGKLTVGVGRNLDDVPLSPDEIDFLLGHDILRAYAAAMALIPTWHELSETRRRALVNMAFNLGQSRMAAFKNMLDAIAKKDYGRAADEMLSSKWATQVGERAKRLAAMMRNDHT